MKLLGSALTVMAAMLAMPAVSYADPVVPAEVALQKTGAGWTFADTKGMTLYTYDRDKDVPGKSACLGAAVQAAGRAAMNEAAGARGGGCIRNWPALSAPADAKPVGDWATITRDDGSKQWAYKGAPLYTYAKDTNPGSTVGDAVQFVWHVAFQPIDTPPEVSIGKTLAGKVLTDDKGMTLYSRSDETAAKAACTGKCLETWQPVAAPWAASSMGDWSVVTRDDGSRQWTFQGKPLYTYGQDVNAGDTEGEGKDNVWRSALLEPPAPMPSWATTQNSDNGRVLADTKGMTIYVFTGDLEKVKRMTCNDECIQKMWRPIVAAADAKPVGNWSIIDNADGTKQWGFKGERLFTFTGDAKPGDTVGERYASGHGHFVAQGSNGWWRLILQSCMCSPPIG